MRYLGIVFMLSALMGCASTEVNSADPTSASVAKPSTTQTAEQEVKETEVSDEKLVCRSEKATGSNRKVRSCRKVSGT